MMKQTLAAFALALVPLTAQAGDPCPIEITVVDLGVPAWLDQNALLAAQGDVQIWLGVSSYQAADGRAISYVHPNSPIANAGITAGGVIQKINGVTIDTEAAYDNAINAVSPGDVLQLAVTQNGTAKRYNVTAGNIDPIPIGIAQALSTRDCSIGEIKIASDADQSRLQPFLYDANRRFRCDDAHIGLGGALPDFTVSEAYILRGSRRIIIAMPPWGSTCVNVSDVSGANLTTGNLLQLIDRVADDYITDRHANP